MSRRGISTILIVGVVVVLLVVAGVAYLVLLPGLGPSSSSKSSSSSSSSSASSSSVASSTSSSQAVVCTQNQTASGNVTVTVADFSFTPFNVTIRAGESVQWFYNPSGTTQHEPTSDTGLFASNAMTAGTKFTCTFNQVGTFPYHCMFHPTVMKGNVIVT